MPRASVLLLLVLGLLAADAGYTMEEEFAIHPDGTPTFPEKLRDHLRTQGGGKWRDDEKLVRLVQGDDLEAFTAYMQEINQKEIFEEDGTASDIQEWRQAVRDDHYYAKLLEDNAPDFYSLIMTGTDMEVQDFLREQHAYAQQEQMRARSRQSAQKSEL